jgi:3-hydroxyisobutyrate dehydrogenase-like beta-hydroxyacid dehydrogenase
VSEPAARIGFIGLGVMGEAMCRNLLTKGGWPVVAHDLNPEPAAQLASEGAEAAKTPHALAETCDMVILCLPGGEQVRRLVLEDGLIARLRPGAILVDMSTSPPALMREIAAEAAARGVRFADAPVARTRQAAADGTLAIMVGGEADLFAEVHPVLATMGADIVHCGDVGAGQIFKILNNMILFQNVAAIAEALAIATRASVDGRLLLETISKGSGDSFALRNHGMKSLLPGEFPEKAFSVRYAAKDLAYARQMAAEHGVRAPGTDHVAALFEKAIEAGEGDRYFPVIARLLAD